MAEPQLGVTFMSRMPAPPGGPIADSPDKAAGSNRFSRRATVEVKTARNKCQVSKPEVRTDVAFIKRLFAPNATNVMYTEYVKCQREKRHYET